MFPEFINCGKYENIIFLFYWYLTFRTLSYIYFIYLSIFYMNINFGKLKRLPQVTAKLIVTNLINIVSLEQESNIIVVAYCFLEWMANILMANILGWQIFSFKTTCRLMVEGTIVHGGTIRAKHFHTRKAFGRCTLFLFIQGHHVIRLIWDLGPISSESD